MIEIEQALLAFGTLFTIVNPFSTSLVFSKLTQGMGTKERRRIAFTASFAALVAMTIFLLVGQPLLMFFGVTIYAFRVAGGLYLAWIGFEMLGPRLRRDPDNYREADGSIAVIPIAIPLLSGPGALTSVLVLSSEMPWVPVLVSILAVSLLSWIVLRQSDLIQKALGHTGTSVVERLLGIIVLVVAVQFVFNGISGYLATLG
ncbi:MarC family protein [Candidatus Woesearchaeota archaeon]|nr:MarC family protein [Candidatus Woesearchaeota archaeon]